jgi:endonuclease YncB( thermonuclease family)
VRRRHVIRLAEVDAPENAQAFGERIKQHLAALCFGRSALVSTRTTDRYRRTVARLACDGIEASVYQVNAGMAWVFDRYVADRSLYAVQDESRGAGRGLWADHQPTPPWEWRRTGQRAR